MRLGCNIRLAMSLDGGSTLRPVIELLKKLAKALLLVVNYSVSSRRNLFDDGSLALLEHFPVFLYCVDFVQQLLSLRLLLLLLPLLELLDFSRIQKHFLFFFLFVVHHSDYFEFLVEPGVQSI